MCLIWAWIFVSMCKEMNVIGSNNVIIDILLWTLKVRQEMATLVVASFPFQLLNKSVSFNVIMKKKIIISISWNKVYCFSLSHFGEWGYLKILHLAIQTWHQTWSGDALFFCKMLIKSICFFVMDRAQKFILKVFLPLLRKMIILVVIPV